MGWNRQLDILEFQVDHKIQWSFFDHKNQWFFWKKRYLYVRTYNEQFQASILLMAFDL